MMTHDPYADDGYTKRSGFRWNVTRKPDSSDVRTTISYDVIHAIDAWLSSEPLKVPDTAPDAYPDDRKHLFWDDPRLPEAVKDWLHAVLEANP